MFIRVNYCKIKEKTGPDRAGSIIKMAYPLSPKIVINDEMEIASAPNDESAGVWQTVTRSGKRSRMNSETSETKNEEIKEKKGIVIIQGENLPGKLGMAKILFKSGMKIEKIKVISGTKIEITFPNNLEAEKAIKNSIFILKKWEVTIKKNIEYTFGVIRRLDLDVTNEEIMEVIKSDNNVVSIKRLSKKGKEGQLTLTTTVSLKFVGKEIPSYVSIYGVKFGVEPYIFRVMQCYCCWRYGHIAQNCGKKEKKLCPKCDEQHETCDKAAKCVNCGGDHPANDINCPKWKNEKEITQKMAKKKVTYKQAKILVDKKKPNLKEKENVKTGKKTNSNNENVSKSSGETSYAEKLKGNKTNTGETQINPKDNINVNIAREILTTFMNGENWESLVKLAVNRLIDTIMGIIKEGGLNEILKSIFTTNNG